MLYLKADTQVIVTIGPFVDVGDGFTPQTDITLGGNEAELIKHGSTSVVDISGATWAAVTDCRGYYSLTLTASHTDTEGQLTVVVQDDSDCLPVRTDFMVVNDNTYEAFFENAAELLAVDVTQIGADAQSATDLKDFADAGYDPGTNKVQGVVLTDTCTTNTDLVSAAAVVNEWETQSQADPTGFHVNVREWLSQAVTLSTGNKPDVNIDEISDDTTAPANLELAYDGTGYAGGTTNLDVNVVTVGGATPTVHAIASGTITTDAVANDFVISDAAASSVNDHYNQHLITVYDDNAGTYQTRVILDYVGATKTVTLKNDLTFTTEGTVDTFKIWAMAFSDEPIAGASANTYTVTDGVDAAGNPIQGVYVWVTTDAAGANIIASGTTASDGTVVFYLDAGKTYYIWKRLSGYTFGSNPESVTAV